MRGSAGFLVLCTAAACGSGSVEVVLDRPRAAEAQLEPAATVVLRAERFDADDVVLTATVNDDAVSFGDLPLGDYHAMSVELFGPTGASVGYGRASEPVDVTFEGNQVVHVPIRRPRVYLAGPSPGRMIEAPLVAPAARLIRMDRGGAGLDVDVVNLPAATALIAAAGPDMFVAAGGRVFRLDSSTDTFDMSPMVDVGAEIRDLAGTADGMYLVAGSDSGLHVIDVVARSVGTLSPGGPVDAVATAIGPGGQVIAIALLGGVRPPMSCTGAASRLFVSGLGDSETAGRTIDLGGGVSDIAAAPGRPLVVAADYCRDRVTVVDLTTDAVWGTVEGVKSPTAVTATDTQAWAVGSIPGIVANPATVEENVDRGAHHQLVVMDMTGATVTGRTTDLPEIAQLIIPSDDPGASLAQNARAKRATASALSLSARGDQLLLSSNAVHRVQQVTITDSIFGVQGVFPPMTVHTSQQYVISTSTGATEQMIATRCKVCTADSHTAGLDFGEGCGANPQEWGYAMWGCAPSGSVMGVVGVDFEAGASAALYGRP